LILLTFGTARHLASGWEKCSFVVVILMGVKSELFVLEYDKTFQTTDSPGKALKVYHSTRNATAPNMLCRVLPRKPAPVIFPCQNYKTPNKSYSVQLTSVPKTGGRSLQLSYRRDKVESRLSW